MFPKGSWGGRAENGEISNWNWYKTRPREFTDSRHFSHLSRDILREFLLIDALIVYTPIPMNVRPLEQLTHTDFSKAVNSRFRVWIDSQDSLEFELFEVTTPRITVAGVPKKSTYENFALHFRGPVDRPLPQRIYCFESVILGRFELFVVPTGQDTAGIQYQATFNRLVKPEE